MTSPKEPLSTSRRMHQKQMFLQVWLPFGAAVLVVTAVAVFVIVLAGRSSPAVAQASNISLVLILAPVMIFGVLYAYLVALAIFLVAKLTGKISPAAKVVQGVFNAISQKTSSVADKMASPLIKTRSIAAAVKRVVKRKR